MTKNSFDAIYPAYVLHRAQLSDLKAGTSDWQAKASINVEFLGGRLS